MYSSAENVVYCMYVVYHARFLLETSAKPFSPCKIFNFFIYVYEDHQPDFVNKIWA